MHNFRFSPKQTKNLMVGLAMAAVIAIPMLAQPLGLALPFTAPVADATKVQETVLPENETASVLPLEAADELELDLNRSRGEADDAAALPTGTGDIDGNELMEDADEAAILGDIDGNELIEDAALEDPAAVLPAEEPEEPADPIADVAAHTVYVTRNGVNMRAEPNTDSTVIARLGMGVKLTATGEMPGWKRVKDAGGREGYVADEFLSKSMVFVDMNDAVYVVNNGVNLRQAPSTGSASLGLLGVNMKLTRTGLGDGWTRVNTATGKTGYIASSFLTTTAPAVPTPKPTAAPAPKPTAPKPTTAPAPKPATGTSSSIAKVVDTAYSMLGVRYVYGSESRSGVDCSGLVLYCYRQIGVSVPRTSSSYANFGTAVSYANMRPGDIIALDTRKSDGRTSITHLGIYVGGGDMIHASSSIGRVVKANVANYLNYSKLITIRRIAN